MKGYRGKWNGELVYYSIINIIVGPEPDEVRKQMEQQTKGRRFLWFENYIGEQRQAVEVNAGSDVFYIDNADGSGMHKIKNGGNPKLAHRTIYPSNILGLAKYSEWVKYSARKYINVCEDIKNRWLEKEPIEYQSHLDKMKRMYQILKQRKKW